jgi:hypothetical protein
MSRDPSQPSYERQEVVDAKPTLELLADLLRGPQHMWNVSAKYIRKWKDETQGVYDIRRKCEPLFGGFSRTLSAATGMLFGVEPHVEWAESAALRPLWDNIDNQGNKGQVLMHRSGYAALRDGLAVLLTDYTKAPEGVVVTAANEAQYNLRPFVVLYERPDVLNWEIGLAGGRRQLLQVTLRERIAVKTMTFGSTEAVRYRELRLEANPETGEPMAVWRLWTKADTASQSGEYVVTDAGLYRNRLGEVAQRLPIAVAVTGVSREPFQVDPPLANVAYSNLAHWRYASSLTFGREVCGFEQLVVTGSIMADPMAPPGKAAIKIGPLVAINVEAGGSVAWIGPSGAGLGQLEKGAREKLEQMDAQGFGFLVPNKAVATTATEERLDSFTQLASLTSAGQAIADAWNVALEWLAWYEGIPAQGAPLVSLETGFDSSSMDAQTMLAYVQLVNAGFPKRQALEALQAGGRITAEADLDELEQVWEGEILAKAQAAKDASSAAGGPPGRRRILSIARGATGRAAEMVDEVDDENDDPLDEGAAS